jgi:predicted aspartyl protease
VQIENIRRPVLVAITDNGEQPLCGYTTLETLGFKVEPVAHRLERRTPIEY